MSADVTLAGMPASVEPMPMSTTERARVAGKASAAARTADQRKDSARKAAAAGHHPKVLARRIHDAWDQMSEDEKAATLAQLWPKVQRLAREWIDREQTPGPVY